MSKERKIGQTVYVRGEWLGYDEVSVKGATVWVPGDVVHDAVPSTPSADEAAVRAVLDLHYMDDSTDGECSECTDNDGAAWPVMWPCPTVRAITAITNTAKPCSDLVGLAAREAT